MIDGASIIQEVSELHLGVHVASVTFNAVSDSIFLETESGWMVSVNAGQGVWCSYFVLEENSSYPHSEQQYTPYVEWKLVIAGTINFLEIVNNG